MTLGDPTFFGPAERPLFGFFHPARAPRRDLAIVVVPPLGYEEHCAHRGLRHLAETLGDAGLATLRYDHDGTGDSAGDDRDPDRVEAWVSGAVAAIDEALRRSGCERVVVVGLRLGAAIALRAAERRDVAGVVAWAPLSGRAYAREVRAFRLMNEGDVRVRGDDEDDESAGFVLTASTRAQLSALDPTRLERAPPRVLVVARDDVRTDDALTNAVRARGASVEVAQVAGYAAMMRDPHLTEVPTAVIAAICTWLEGLSGPASGDVPAIPLVLEAEAFGVRERLVRFGDRERLFGVVTEPVAGGRQSSPVVFTNAGAIHRVGPNRMYVRFARAWAKRGVVSIRYDAPGLGDSRPRDGLPDNRRPFVDPAREVADAIAQVGPRAIIMGLCAGAHVAYHAALGVPGVRSVILMNPQRLHIIEGDPFEAARRDASRAFAWYRTAGFRRRSWERALRGEADLAKVARVLGRRLLERVRELLPAKPRAPGEPDVGAELEAISARGVPVTFVFASADPGRDHLWSMVGGRRLAALARRGVYREVLLGDADHTFTPVASQTALESLLTRYVVLPR